MEFKHATLDDLETIFNWLNEPHVRAFWDNSDDHRADIINFTNGRHGPAPYFNGIFVYWVGRLEREPYCLIMTAREDPDPCMPALWQAHRSQTGTTYSLDFCIGNPKFLGQGLAAPTLAAFTRFFQKNVDPGADTFFIDPDLNNPRAIHVYEKAGFQKVGTFRRGHGFFAGHHSILMVQKRGI